MAQTTLLSGVLLLLPVLATAQGIVPARAGLIYQAQGRVLLNEKPIAEIVALTGFHEVREDQHLRTEQGRAKLFLAPEVVLGADKNTHLEMLGARFSDVRVRLIAGSATVEADQLERSHSITLCVGDAAVHLERSGLYRLQLGEKDHSRLQVFAGRAVVSRPGAAWRVNAKKETELAGDFAVGKLDVGGSELFDRWKKRRSLAVRTEERPEPRLIPWWTLPGFSVP